MAVDNGGKSEDEKPDWIFKYGNVAINSGSQ
jgi:hypothetical protein